jgi:hypothetical protein
MSGPVIGYHASHEQIPPSALLRNVVAAEQAGFQAGMCSDRFTPWSVRQANSGFAWAWLGAALQATGLPFGAVNAPGQRYHPAIVAQAAATLSEMFPGRFWLAEYAELGFDEIYLHEVGQDPYQQPFIDAFGSKVIPALATGASRPNPGQEGSA